MNTSRTSTFNRWFFEIRREFIIIDPIQKVMVHIKFNIVYFKNGMVYVDRVKVSQHIIHVYRSVLFKQGSKQVYEIFNFSIEVKNSFFNLGRDRDNIRSFVGFYSVLSLIYWTKVRFYNHYDRIGVMWEWFLLLKYGIEVITLSSLITDQQNLPIVWRLCWCHRRLTVSQVQPV
jgi:hypothetical protein